MTILARPEAAATPPSRRPRHWCRGRSPLVVRREHARVVTHGLDEDGHGNRIIGAVARNSGDRSHRRKKSPHSELGASVVLCRAMRCRHRRQRYSFPRPADRRRRWEPARIRIPATARCGQGGCGGGLARATSNARWEPIAQARASPCSLRGRGLARGQRGDQSDEAARTCSFSCTSRLRSAGRSGSSSPSASTGLRGGCPHRRPRRAMRDGRHD
jgi:hypothetical protein